MNRFAEFVPVRAVTLLAISLLGTARVTASPFYTVQDLGTVSAVQAQSVGELIGIDQNGNVSFYPNGGLNFGNAAKPPVPTGDQPYYTVMQASDNGLYSAGNAWNPAGQQFDTYLVNRGGASLISPLVPGNAPQAAYPLAVNNSGQVVGYANVVSSSGASIATSGPFIYSPGQGSTFIWTAGGVAYGINNLGRVVGGIPFQAPTDASLHAFLWTGPGRFPLDLNMLIDSSKWALTTATGINDAGQIVAYGTDPSGKYHSLLLNPNDPSATLPTGPTLPGIPAPVPEPSTLIFVGLVMTGLSSRELIRQAALRRAGR
jgi:hypothetical protein